MKQRYVHAHIIDPASGFDGPGELLVEDGKILEMGSRVSPGEETIDCEGLVLAPGLVDMHVHLRDPGFTQKEDILTGCAAAAAGGVTSLLCMPNTKPVTDSPEVVAYIREKAKNAKAKVYVTGAITRGMKSEALNDLAALKAAGVTALSDDGRPVENARLMAEALKQAKELHLCVTSHCEDLAIINGGIVNDGAPAKALGLPGMHRSSEDTITAREIILAETNDCAVHIAHVSTRLSVQLIREAKARGVRVTAETCPHYFMLTEEELYRKDANFRMNPPLREEADRQAVLAGVLDGTIDCIVTDHAPHTPAEKADFYKAPNGVIGMETSFAAANTALVESGKLSLSGLIAKMSTRPAEILGIEAGRLAPGAAADFVLLDPKERWTVDASRFASKARNAIFEGQTLTGRVRRTYLDGVPVFTQAN